MGVRTLTFAVAVVTTLAAGLIVGAGCSSFSGASPAGDAGPDVAEPDASEAPPPAVLDASDAAPDAGGMIDVGSFRIDAKEVTNADYNAFLEASLTLDAGVLSVPGCAFNVTFARKCSSKLDPDVPVTCINWCDAAAYCASVDKHLCGSLTGDELTFGDALDPTKSEWMRACAGIDGQAYPYGTTADAGLCQTNETADGGPTRSGSRPGCKGRPAGLFDMSGNVAEWEGSCSLDGAVQDNRCRVRGGSFKSNAVDAKCAADSYVMRRQAMDDIGFRCCSR
ncbi:MAG: SUMF1/EgtB/PvdO family nonheme iron enzyme [Labilithrix sp.]|nr:SUMF1/EgtB/PvdO family nonheme iron enzyme [Labilithrix sp.]